MKNIEIDAELAISYVSEELGEDLEKVRRVLELFTDFMEWFSATQGEDPNAIPDWNNVYFIISIRTGASSEDISRICFEFITYLETIGAITYDNNESE